MLSLVRNRPIVWTASADAVARVLHDVFGVFEWYSDSFDPELRYHDADAMQLIVGENCSVLFSPLQFVEFVYSIF
jgi:hypothetical protein